MGPSSKLISDKSDRDESLIKRLESEPDGEERAAPEDEDEDDEEEEEAGDNKGDDGLYF